MFSDLPESTELDGCTSFVDSSSSPSEELYPASGIPVGFFSIDLGLCCRCLSLLVDNLPALSTDNRYTK